MKIEISTQRLYKALSNLYNVIPKTAIIPICRSFLFEPDGNMVKISATNMESHMQVTIDCDITNGLPFCVSADLLYGIVKLLPCNEVNFTGTDPENKGFIQHVTMTADKGTYKLASEDPQFFPRIGLDNDDVIASFSIPAPVIGEMLSKTYRFVNEKDHRPSLSGVWLHTDGKVLQLCGSDGHALARIWHSFEEPGDMEMNVIMPKAFCQHAHRFLEGGTAHIYAGKNRLAISSIDYRLSTTLIDGKYPDIEAIWTHKPEKKVKLPKEVFINAMKRLRLFAEEENKVIAFYIKDQEVELQASDEGNDNIGTESLYALEKTGVDIIIGFNAGLVTKLLSSMT